MKKIDKSKNPKRAPYDKPLTLAPLTFEEAVKVMLQTPPMPKDSKKKNPRKVKVDSNGKQKPH